MNSGHTLTVHYSMRSAKLAELLLQSEHPCLIVCQTARDSEQLKLECEFYTPADFECLSFPDWETLPYDHFSPHEDIISERLKVLSTLPTLKRGALFVNIATLMHRLPPTQFVHSHSLILRKKQIFNLKSFRNHLIEIGYTLVSQVYAHGEFAIRGSILDIFAMGTAKPIRIDLFDEIIDSLHYFDPESQRSVQAVDSIEILPAHEFPLSPEAIAGFRTRWRMRFSGDPMRSRVYESISKGQSPAGIEYYLPLFFEQNTSLLDFLPEKSKIIKIDDIADAANLYEKEVKTRYELYRHDLDNPRLPPQEIIFYTSEILSKINALDSIHLKNETSESDSLKAIQTLLLKSSSEKKLQPLKNLINAHPDKKIFFSAETSGRKETLLKLISSEFQPTSISSWGEFQSKKSGVFIGVSPIQSGFISKDFLIITEIDLLGEHVTSSRSKTSKTQTKEWLIRNLAELNIDDPVVHELHGIGIYKGLVKLTIQESESEYLQLEYANQDKIYVPIEKLNLISRYTGVDKEHVSLNRLGTKQWESAKRKAIEKIKDTAAELLSAYAARESTPGFAHAALDHAYYEFASHFQFEETPDQLKTLDEVISDMTSPRPMDRLVCGDVGFGKTEIAMRAAFIAVQSGTQVAVLVPTTLLAQQHYESFKNRFSEFPVVIHSLSRFSSEKEKLNTLNLLKEGKIDILIGTHALLNHIKAFKKLGLIVIDEEHRFGVSQKEKLKSIRANIDVLTLTATPIPRTLNMAMHAIRDLSIIASPPKRRLSIKTFVRPFESLLVREAILREILRGGQVYYLHNNVSTIEKTAEFIQNLIPEAKVKIAHGQMPEKILEQTMTDFYHQRFNILVCTTIIETGIDIPSANTIIMDRADLFGLSQLHQLRGRVGRSHHQAYAYLLTPQNVPITSDAEKRLEAIQSLEDLGAGFMLATHDLEIRGAGEILGEEQSGHMQSIGFSLYTELLERAVKSLKSGQLMDLETPHSPQIEINLHIPAFIPDDYLPDVHIRLLFYKRISACENAQALYDLEAELIDRFGNLPYQAKNLFQYSTLRLLCASLGIQKVEVLQEAGFIEFSDTPHIHTGRLIQYIQEQPHTYKLKGQKRLVITGDFPPEKRLEKVRQLIESLQMS